MDTSASADPSGASPPPPPPPFDPANPPGPRQLRRRPEQGHIAGVCAGVAEYFNVDPVIVRIAAVVLLVSGPGLIAYILAWIFVPEARSDAPIVAPTEPADAKDRGMQIFGIVLLALAVSVLWGDWWSPSRRWLFPVGLMALGAWLLLRRGDGRPIHQHGSPSHWHGSHWSGRNWGGVHDTGGT
ncbi:MAG TPA: PspC domain-containing protein, partial [Acidimicrobiales bacterium]